MLFGVSIRNLLMRIEATRLCP